jgi:hypothetical protein
MLDPSRFYSFNLFRRLFDGLAAGGTAFILKKLKFPTAFVLAFYIQCLSAAVAAVRTDEGFAAAIRAHGFKCTTAPGAGITTALNRFKAVRAMIPERRSAAAFRTNPRTPLNQRAAALTRNFIICHI